MQPHQERVVTEKSELDDKIEKLEAFKENVIYAKLPDDEQLRLTRQLFHMADYSHVLGERIAAFSKD